ncbi:hypothetical protein ECHHL_0230 [Ehrlichia chaffeensis str. Heartland]|uniref:hypothetical protein n=1 Tax=Ehrlichia chaffeensis TaxID=945 RepID=UPI000444E20A|nr:hypothetical protein [Ehrlichia chaffeensis]AHX03396.1 hypothetical protein ECHHL_0230 [Ehrlichia chaffeensis str. Heartland]AHX08737.1 hypothetical protein ECHSTV_0817 [Ehrlichia chaffeensis str. Saint Vincent]AHX10781.1 hypothetical protein ECHWP_0228 [Ehrlichia chaffeensis str. West Paces]
MSDQEKTDTSGKKVDKLKKVHNAVSKVAQFIVGDSLSLQLKEYKVSFSYIVDNTTDYLKLTNVQEVKIIEKINQLKNINNTLLERLFNFWLRRNKQLLYWHMIFLLVNIILLILNGDNLVKLSNLIVEILIKWKDGVVSLYCS